MLLLHQFHLVGERGVEPPPPGFSVRCYRPHKLLAHIRQFIVNAQDLEPINYTHFLTILAPWVVVSPVLASNEPLRLANLRFSFLAIRIDKSVRTWKTVTPLYTPIRPVLRRVTSIPPTSLITTVEICTPHDTVSEVPILFQRRLQYLYQAATYFAT